MSPLLSICGLDCETCEARIATINNDDNLRKAVAEKWCALNQTDLITPESIHCLGCHTKGEGFFCNWCQIRPCAESRGFLNCGECFEMDSCPKLAPLIQHNPEARKNLELLRSKRLLLRPFQESDAEVVYSYASDPDIGCRAGWPPHQSVEESREVINTLFKETTTWAICRKEDGMVIGAMGYGPSCQCNLPARENEPIVGYWVGKPHWNQGFCTEALQLMLNFIRTETPIRSLISSHFVDNPASGKVLEKCGFVPTGETAFDEDLYNGGDKPMRVLRLELR